MRALIQRVSRAEVRVGGRVTGTIGRGMLVLLAAAEGDDAAAAAWLAAKVAGLRIFADERGRMNRDVREVGGGLLVVPQFTLYGDARRGRRPEFLRAAQAAAAAPLFEAFCAALDAAGVAPERGVFGAQMEVELVNDGPVTLLVDSPGAAAGP